MSEKAVNKKALSVYTTFNINPDKATFTCNEFNLS